MSAPRQAPVAEEGRGEDRALSRGAASSMRSRTSRRGSASGWCSSSIRPGGGARRCVLPRGARSAAGVFATRSPHRPNPIGMSAVRLVASRGANAPRARRRHPRRFAGARPEAVRRVRRRVPRCGLRLARACVAGPSPRTIVTWSDEARAAGGALGARRIELVEPVERALALGPEAERLSPHPTTEP